MATVKLTTPEGEKTLEIRKNKDEVYARSSTLDGVYKVNKDAADGFNKAADDFRAKKVFDFGFTDPSRIEYKDGSTSEAWEKSGEKWMSKGKEVDAVTVQNPPRNAKPIAALAHGFTMPKKSGKSRFG